MINNYDLKIREWIKKLTSENCTINSIKNIWDYHKKNGEMLFALIDADVTSAEGNKLPNIVFIRGHACLIVPMLKNKTTGEEKFLMVRQRRIGNGQFSLEFPAGMLDQNTDDPMGVALRELEEETGLKITREELFPLSNDMLYSSAGATDEGIYFYGCTKVLDNDDYIAFYKRIAGNVDESEHIVTELLTRSEAEPLITSLQARLGFFLFETTIKSRT